MGVLEHKTEVIFEFGLVLPVHAAGKGSASLVCSAATASANARPLISSPFAITKVTWHPRSDRRLKKHEAHVAVIDRADALHSAVFWERIWSQPLRLNVALFLEIFVAADFPPCVALLRMGPGRELLSVRV